MRATKTTLISGIANYFPKKWRCHKSANALKTHWVCLTCNASLLYNGTTRRPHPHYVCYQTRMMVVIIIITPSYSQKCLDLNDESTSLCKVPEEECACLLVTEEPEVGTRETRHPQPQPCGERCIMTVQWATFKEERRKFSCVFFVGKQELL